ncbi:TetR/AcrR family transcriptional regulator [Mycobacterium malmoense]|nr:TetR/AcrR family transcriptional regulator [Mycobacterium malmoense]
MVFRDVRHRRRLQTANAPLQDPLSSASNLRTPKKMLLSAFPILAIGPRGGGRIVNMSHSGSPPSHGALRERPRVDQNKSAVVPFAKMSSSQQKRQAKIVDAVIALIAEAGAEAVQMRDVAQRSGVALATVYKYFNSKEDLLAAALDGWQKRVAGLILGTDELPDQDPVHSVLGYLRRSQRAFNSDREIIALALQLTISTDLAAKVAVDQMRCTNAKIFSRLVDVVAPEDLQHLNFGLSGALTGSLIGLLTGRVTLEESLNHVEWVARALLGEAQPRTRKWSTSLRAREEIDETE